MFSVHACVCFCDSLSYLAAWRWRWALRHWRTTATEPPPPNPRSSCCCLASARQPSPLTCTGRGDRRHIDRADAGVVRLRLATGARHYYPIYRSIFPLQYTVGDSTLLLDFALSRGISTNNLPFKCSLGQSAKALGAFVVINLIIQVRARCRSPCKCVLVHVCVCSRCVSWPCSSPPAPSRPWTTASVRSARCLRSWRLAAPWCVCLPACLGNQVCSGVSMNE